jgi:hypothetical protein
MIKNRKLSVSVFTISAVVGACTFIFETRMMESMFVSWTITLFGTILLKSVFGIRKEFQVICICFWAVMCFHNLLPDVIGLFLLFSGIAVPQVCALSHIAVDGQKTS